MSEITDKAVEAVSEASEFYDGTELAEGAEQALRSLTGIKLSYAALGAACGVAVGAFIGFRLAYKKAQTKADDYVANEVDTMRKHYQDKALALENAVEKPKLEDLVRERGYTSTDSTRPPLAVAPPAAVVEAAEEAREAEPTTPSPTVAVKPEPVVERHHNVFEDAQVEDNWNYERELRGRSPVTPYIIHVDEQEEMGYETVTLTYYEGDDVLCRDDDSVIPEEDRDALVGEKNMVRFGHGSRDVHIVYIRNDEKEIQFEVIRSRNSYAEEVHGFRHSAGPRRRERHVFDDE